MGISAGVLGWALLIAPYVYDPGLTVVQLLVSAGYLSPMNFEEKNQSPAAAPLRSEHGYPPGRSPPA